MKIDINASLIQCPVKCSFDCNHTKVALSFLLLFFSQLLCRRYIKRYGFWHAFDYFVWMELIGGSLYYNTHRFTKAAFERRRLFSKPKQLVK